MDAAYHAEPWAGLALGMAGAAAALAGLLFVAVSINLEAILEAGTPHYAGEALIMLVAPVFIGLAVAVPAQPATALGAELLTVAAISGPVLGWLSRPGARSRDQPFWAWFVANPFAAAGLTVGLGLAGLGVLTTSLGGLYWLPVAIAAGLAGGLANAWSLLVELRRND